jgi:hypothetical protein
VACRAECARHLYILRRSPTYNGRHPYNPQRRLYTALQIAGIGGNVKYYNPIFEYRHYNGMHGIKPSKGTQRFAFRFRTVHSGHRRQGAHPTSAQGGEQEMRGIDIRSSTPYAFIPQRTQLSSPTDGSLVPATRPIRSATSPSPSPPSASFRRRRYLLHQQHHYRIRWAARSFA